MSPPSLVFRCLRTLSAHPAATPQLVGGAADPASGTAGEGDLAAFAPQRVVQQQAAAQAAAGAGDRRHVRRDAGGIDHVPRLEIVGAVEDDVVAGDEVGGQPGIEPGLDRIDGDERVDRQHRRPRRLHLGHADAVLGMSDLALEVGARHHVVVDHGDRADPGRREVEQRWRAEPARADHKHLGALQLLLAAADLAQHDVARIAINLALAEPVGRDRNGGRDAVVGRCRYRLLAVTYRRARARLNLRCCSCDG